MTRNFFAGPCALPPSVLRRIHDQLHDYDGRGLSVLEISHRDRSVVDLIDDTVARLKQVLEVGEDFEILLMQGGASLQFAMVPMNFSKPGDAIDYVESGIWAARAIAEAGRLDRDCKVVASSAPGHTDLPTPIIARPQARYLHLCSNNTIVGTQFFQLPSLPVPLIADLSSDILALRRDHRAMGCFYAHAQKSFGASGVTIVGVRKDLMDRIPDGLPAILDYRVHAKARSNYNTPPVFSIYVVRLVLDWLMQEVGGLDAMEALNRAKAQLLYQAIDQSDFYTCPVDESARSLMNVVFRLPNADMEADFLAKAEQAGLLGLAGHRAWGGCRASLYNAVTLEDVSVLVQFMDDFRKQRGGPGKSASDAD